MSPLPSFVQQLAAAQRNLEKIKAEDEKFWTDRPSPRRGRRRETHGIDDAHVVASVGLQKIMNRW